MKEERRKEGITLKCAITARLCYRVKGKVTTRELDHERPYLRKSDYLNLFAVLLDRNCQ